ncbi:MAG TPA: alpha/beta hydrolase [Gammaproteobacteria bacterium]|nr:alpha/beta hydrolase [Gammaproteobacteria bacterium]
MKYLSTNRLTCFALLFLVSAATNFAIGENYAVRQPVVLEYKKVNEEVLNLVFHEPRGFEKKRAAVILLHGGGWTEGKPLWTYDDAEQLASLGLVSVSVAYRLSNRQVTPIDAINDVCDAYYYLVNNAEALNLDPDRILAHGVSAGAHLGSSLATVGCGNRGPRPKLRALLLWSPALDLVNDDYFKRLLRGRSSAAQFSPLANIQADIPPVFIVQGERDSQTPLVGAERFCEKVVELQQRCELAVYPNVGHLLSKNLLWQVGAYWVDKEAKQDALARQTAFIRSLDLHQQADSDW